MLHNIKTNESEFFSDEVLDSKFVMGSKFSNIIRSNNKVLSNSRYFKNTVSPIKNVSPSGNQKLASLENSLSSHIFEKNIPIREVNRNPRMHNSFIKDHSFTIKHEEPQSFLPFLNKRRREALSNVRAHKHNENVIYKTEDTRNHINEYNTNFVEDNTEATVVSHKDAATMSLHKRVNKTLFDQPNILMDTSISNWSKFYDDFSKMKSEKTLERFNSKDLRSLNQSNTRNEFATLNKDFNFMSVNIKNQIAISESKELKQSLDRIDEILGENMKFQPNKVLFRLYEVKWREAEEELKSFKLNKSELSIKQKHVLYNKATIDLMKSMRHGFPELSKTLFRIIEGLNEVINLQDQ